MLFSFSLSRVSLVLFCISILITHIKYLFYDIDDAYDTLEAGHLPALIGGRAGYLLYEDENGKKEIIVFKGGYIEYDGKTIKVALREFFDPKALDPEKIKEEMQNIIEKLTYTKDEKEQKNLEDELLTIQKFYLAVAKAKTYFEK